MLPNQPPSSSAPRRSRNFSQDIPVKIDRPAANSASSSRVPPVKPKNWANSRPTSWPSMPPGSSGSGFFMLWKRSASRPLEADSSTMKPDRAMKKGRRSVWKMPSRRR
jgi:hypothetical protein